MILGEATGGEANVRTLIVHNNKAGFGSDAIFEFERALVRGGDECVFRSVSESLTSTQALADAEDFDVAVLSGGDGTVTSMLYDLRFRDVTCCVFPSGTANLLFANLGLAQEPSSVARACRVGATASIDLGELSWIDAEGARRVSGFGLMSGSGFDARIMRAAIPNKQSMGEFSYYQAALENAHPEVEHFTIRVDDEVVERDGISCIVANTATIQGDIQVVPDCRMDDGLTDVIVLETQDATQLLRPIFMGLIDREGKTLGRPYIESWRGRKVRVESGRPIPLEIDGDPVGDDVTSWGVNTLAGACRVIVDEMSPYHGKKVGAPRFGAAAQKPYPEA